jgi:hypothetical protein
MTDDQNDQRGLFPSTNGWNQPARRIITAGDWLSIQHEGRTVVGMVYRRENKEYRFVYWNGGILRFGTATRDQIGRWDEELTAQFRGQIAVIPDYVERCITEWMMQPEERIKARLAAVKPKPARGESRVVQKRLFPE